MSNQTAKLVARIAENLPEMSKEIMQYWIEHPRELGFAVARVLAPKPKLKVWKTVKLGTGPKSVDDFCRAIEGAGMKVVSGFRDCGPSKLHFNVVTGREVEVDLVLVTVAELGLRTIDHPLPSQDYSDQARPYDATRENIYKQALRLGLELCTAEVGLRLRLQYTDQHEGERIFIGMEPIVSTVDSCFVSFIVECDDNVLKISAPSAGLYFDDDNLFVFVLPRHK